MHLRRWQQYEKVWVARRGQSIINFIILYIFICIVAKGDPRTQLLLNRCLALSELEQQDHCSEITKGGVLTLICVL